MDYYTKYREASEKIAEVSKLQKTISAVPEGLNMLVIELPGNLDLPAEHYEMVQTKLRNRIKEQTGHDLFVVLVPNGTKVKLFNTGVHHYHRERLSGYEVEIVGRSEEDIQKRLEFIQAIPKTGATQ